MSKPDTATPISSLRSKKDQIALDQLCLEISSFSARISVLEKQKREAMSKAIVISQAYNAPKIRGEGWLLFRSEGRKTLSKELLLEQGVSMEVIEAATVEGEPFYQVRRSATADPTASNGEG